MNKPSALIIEDDTYQADLFSIALQQADFETTVITNGQTALDWLETALPHLIILDLHLPKVSGSSILEHIRSDPRLAQVRVILATADSAAASLLEDQSDLILLKPISVIQLKELASRFRP